MSSKGESSDWEGPAGAGLILDLKQEICSARPYGEWVKTHLITLDALKAAVPTGPRGGGAPEGMAGILGGCDWVGSVWTPWGGEGTGRRWGRGAVVEV